MSKSTRVVVWVLVSIVALALAWSVYQIRTHRIEAPLGAVKPSKM